MPPQQVHLSQWTVETLHWVLRVLFEALTGCGAFHLTSGPPLRKSLAPSLWKSFHFSWEVHNNLSHVHDATQVDLKRIRKRASVQIFQGRKGDAITKTLHILHFIKSLLIGSSFPILPALQKPNGKSPPKSKVPGSGERSNWVGLPKLPAQNKSPAKPNVKRTFLPKSKKTVKWNN